MTSRGRSTAWAVVVAAVSILGVAACSSDSSATRDARPNIVFILVDDLDQTGGPYWEAMPKSRELFVEHGLEFENAFVTSPVCCPSRASIVSGRYPHNSGVFSGGPPDGGYETFAHNGVESKTMAVDMRAAGYRTAFFGKYLNGYEKDYDQVPPGWDEWFGLGSSFLDGYGYKANHNGKIESYGHDTDDYQTDVLSRNAQAFVEGTEREDDRPFLLFMSPSAPHAPIKPAPRDRDNPFANAALPERPNFNEQDVSDKPTWIREGRKPLSDAQIEAQTQSYRNAMGSLYAVDDMVDALVHELQKNGEFEHTIFVFSSDNGFNRGAHRLGDKTVPYDESARVPLAVSGPGIRVGKDDHYVTNLDFAPSFLELGGQEIPDDFDGRSLIPLFGSTANDLEWRSDFAIEFNGTYNESPLDTEADVQRFTDAGQTVPFAPSYRAIRTTEWLYVEWYGGDEHDYELYDMKADPYQLTNLLATPDGVARYDETTTQLQTRLRQIEACHGPSCR